jgi:hypothetical protein
LIPAARLAILTAGQGSDFDCAPDQGSGFKVQQHNVGCRRIKNDTLKIVSLVEASTTTEEEAHETS